MDVDAVLCNYAEVAEGRLFVAGGGITMGVVGPEPPHVIRVGLGCVVHIPYQATNQPHSLTVDLLTEDGDPVVPYGPEGQPPSEPVRLEVPFNVGRPPLLTAGDPQDMALASNFVNLPLSNLGVYVFVVAIDGTDIRRLPFRVMTAPPGFG